jgi:hypothetical protein
MKEKLDRVIKKIILPHYPNIVNYTLTWEGSRKMTYNFVFDRPIYKDISTYSVTYIFDNNKSMDKLLDKVTEETNMLFDMLNPSDNEELNIYSGWSKGDQSDKH